MPSLFSIFKLSNNTFEGEESGEKVILLLRRHPFVIVIKLLFYLFLAFVPILVLAQFSYQIYSRGLLEIFFFTGALWFTLLWQAAFYSLTMYSLDVWIVTDRRIIDSTQHGFWHRTISELHLSRIQDITVNTKGVMPTFLRFGDLHVQTAAAEDKFLFMQIPNPERVKDEIMKVIKSLRRTDEL